MPGPDRILDAIQQTLEGQAKLKQDAAIAVVKGQTQRQILAGKLKLGLLRGVHDARTEAHELSPSEAPPQQAPFTLNLGDAIAESRINSKEPLQSVNPAQFSSVLQGLSASPGGGAPAPQPSTPSALQGLPQAGAQTVTQSQQATLAPERVGQQGFVLVPQFSERTDTAPNALSAADVLRARIEESQHRDRMTLETLKADREQRNTEFTQAIQARKSLLDTAEVAREEGFSPQESTELQEAVRIGDKEAISRLTAGRKTLQDKATEATINLQNAEAAYHRSQANSLGFKLTPGQTKIDEEFGKYVGGMGKDGGFQQAKTNISLLEKVLHEIKPAEEGGLGQSLTGPALASMGRVGRLLFNPNSEDAKGTVARIVQQSARQILGAAYTEREGENLVNTAYDIGLDEKHNASRLQSFIDTAKAQIEENESRYQYFLKNHTLSGYEGALAGKEPKGKEGDGPAAPPAGDLTALSDAELERQIREAQSHGK